MRHAWGLSKPSGSLSTVRSASKRGGRLQALHRDVYPHDSSAPPHAVSNREKGLRALGRVRSTPTPRPAHRSSLTAHESLPVYARASTPAVGSTRQKRALAIAKALRAASFASAAKTSAKVKRTCQEHPSKRRRRAPSRAPNRCKYLPQRITHENREPWPTPTSLNRSPRPRRRKKKPRPRPPP